MKKDLSVLEIRQIIEEFQFLVNGRMEKIYQPSKKEFIFKIHITGGSKFLNLRDRFIYLSQEKGEIPEKPTTFCSILRKTLENKKIKKIWQKGSERTIVFETEAVLLIIELFGQTNMVLCNQDYSIIASNRTGKELRKWETYSFPKKIDVFKITEKDFSEKISGSAAVKAIASLVGGTYAEEICFRSGIDKNKVADPKEMKLLYAEFTKLKDETVSPTVIFEENGPVDAVLFDLKIYENKNKVAFSNFYEAIESYVSQMAETVIESDAEKQYKGLIERTERIIGLQEDTIKKLTQELEQNQRTGELIYENYQKVEKILDDAKKGRENKSIVSADKKNQSITIEI